MVRKHTVITLFSFCCSLLALLPFTGRAETYERAADLDAATLLGRDSLRTGHYTIADKVENDGLMNRYRVFSDIQILEVRGNQMLGERLHEIEAIAALREVKQTEAFGNGLKAAANAPITLTRNLITDPVGTLGALPGGLGNLLQDVGAALSGIGKGKQDAGDAMIKDLIGFNRVKRRLAAELGVDPYSTNKVLQQELNDVAWSMFAGGAPIDVAMLAAPVAASLSLRIADSSQGEHLDWKTSPATLLQAAEQAGQAMGLDEEESTALVHHAVCSPRHVTVTVSALVLLQDVSGRDDFLRRATAAREEADCQRNMQTAKLLYLYHVNEQPLEKLDYLNDILLAGDTAGATLHPAQADYLIWNRDNARRLTNASGHAIMEKLWLTGSVSAMARQQLADRGVALREHALKNSRGVIDVLATLLPRRVTGTATSE